MTVWKGVINENTSTQVCKHLVKIIWFKTKNNNFKLISLKTEKRIQICLTMYSAYKVLCTTDYSIINKLWTNIS